MKQVTITCDDCGADVSATGAMPAFRLTLSVEALPSESNFRYGVMVYPPIERDHHFCGMKCLKNWALKPAAAAVSASA